MIRKPKYLKMLGDYFFINGWTSGNTMIDEMPLKLPPNVFVYRSGLAEVRELVLRLVALKYWKK